MSKVFSTLVLSTLVFVIVKAQDVVTPGSGSCNGAAVSGTWTVPCNVTSITVELYGGGGGGGGSSDGSNGGVFCKENKGGGGAGGGGYSSRTFNVTPGSTFTYSVGAGGCGGSGDGECKSGDNGTDGGNTTFSGTDAGGGAISMAANGGQGGRKGGSGSGAPAGGPANGGTASGGTTNTTGGGGLAGATPGSYIGGAGGAGAGPAGGAGGAAGNHSNGGAGGTYGGGAGGGAGSNDEGGGSGGAGGLLITYVTTITPPSSPTVTVTPATCSGPGTATIDNYDNNLTYVFSPSGPTIGSGGVISNMTPGSPYTLVIGTGVCATSPSAPFSIDAVGSPPATPTINSTAASCGNDGTSTITNYIATGMTYVFSPSGPSAGTGGVISGMTVGQSYTVIADDGSCQSTASSPFSNAAALPLPTATITGNLSYCTGGNTTLTASGGTTYAWADLTTLTPLGTNASVTVTQGNYGVSVTNSSGCSDTATATVTEISTLPVTITGTLDYCPGGNTTITANGGVSFLWNNSSTNASITVTAGSYSVTATDANGCTGTASETVTEFTAPVVSISGTLSYCEGGNTTLTASGATGYAWSDAANSTTAAITATQGSYTVTGTDANSCTATASASVNENPAPTVAIGGNLTYCTGGNTTLTASGGTSYVWSSSETTAAITVTQGTYTVTVTDANTCTGTATATVTESANLSASIAGNLTICPGATTTLTASGGTSYTWSNGSTADNVTVGEGSYTVTASDATCTGTASATVTAYTVAAFSLGNDLTSCEDSVVVIDAGSGYTGYNWSSGETSQSISPTSSGTYSVTVSDANSCTSTDGVSVTFKNCTVVNNLMFIPTAFSPNGDGNNDIFRASGVNVRDISFSVYNRWGELVYSSQNFLDGWDGLYQGVAQPMGVYVYYVKATFLDGSAKEYKGSVTLIR